MKTRVLNYLPVKMSSLAREVPTMRGSRCVPPALRQWWAHGKEVQLGLGVGVDGGWCHMHTVALTAQQACAAPPGCRATLQVPQPA